jgi:hypothetical protein
MLFANSDNDKIFPMDGNRRIIARLRQIYKMYRKPRLVDEYISKGGHADRPDLRVAAFKWINKHIKGETGPVKKVEFKHFPDKELRVFQEDKDIPKDALNGKIDETFVPRAQVKLPGEGEFPAWKKALLRDLTKRSFRSFPKRIPAGKLGKTRSLGHGPPLIELTTEMGIEVELLAVNQKKKPKTATLIVWNQIALLTNMVKSVKAYEDDALVVSFHPRGIGVEGFGLEWTEKSPPNYVKRAHALLGKTVDQGRVWDIGAAVNSFEGKVAKDCRWRVVGRGQGGILAAYAALFEPAIKEVVVIDPPKSHREGPIFLNVLRVLDIPEALGLLAPRKLTLINAKDKAFDRTVQIYKLAGAEKNLTRK